METGGRPGGEVEKVFFSISSEDNRSILRKILSTMINVWQHSVLFEPIRTGRLMGEIRVKSDDSARKKIYDLRA